MDDQDRASTLTTTVLVAAGAVAVALAAREAWGARAAELVLAAAMVAVVFYAYATLTGRPVRRPVLRARRPVPAPPAEDTWRSERWIAEAVERGLRALDEWRAEQRPA